MFDCTLPGPAMMLMDQTSELEASPNEMFSFIGVTVVMVSFHSDRNTNQDSLLGINLEKNSSSLG